MHLNDIQSIFNRALELSLDSTKWLITFCVLILCGLFVVFSRGLAENANPWIAMSLTFLPIFLCAGIWLALGIVLIRGYHDEIKKKPVNYSKIVANSWETMLGASYFTVPVMLIYLILWMFLGIFLLLRSIPSVGDFFAVILAFAPFLLNLAMLLLCAFVVGVLFFVTPIIALKGLGSAFASQLLWKRLRADMFSNLLLLTIGIFPLLLYFGFLVFAAYLTGSICDACTDLIHTVLHWFFIMIPFAALLAPAVIFFFNFAAEAHVLMQRRIREALR